MKKIMVSAAYLALAAALILISARAAAIDPESSQVIVYENPQCQGEPYMILKVGEYPDLGAYNISGKDSPTWNESVSCMKIGNDVKVKVFKHTNYKGMKKTFTKTADNKGTVSLANDPWDNSISSIKITSSSGR